MPTDPVLTNKAEVRQWANFIGLPAGYAEMLVDLYLTIKPDDMNPEQLKIWQDEQAYHLTVNPAMRLSDEDRRYVTQIIFNIGKATTFGRALVQSEFRHSSELWHTIAKHGGHVHRVP